MDNRKRNNQLKIYLTDEEKEIFEKKMKLANCKTMSHFLRKCVLEKEIYVIDLEPFRDLQWLLSNATNNINQIAKATNKKVQFTKGYEVWARKHNIKTMADSIIKHREQGINSITQLDDLIKKSADDRQDLLDKIKKIETEMKSLSKDMENINTINKYREIYKYHKKNPEDRQFEEEYYSELSVYKIATKKILENYKKLPNTKEILTRLDKLQEKKNTLMQEYSSSKSTMDEFYKIRKNYGIYMGKEMER